MIVIKFNSYNSSNPISNVLKCISLLRHSFCNFPPAFAYIDCLPLHSKFESSPKPLHLLCFSPVEFCTFFEERF